MIYTTQKDRIANIIAGFESINEYTTYRLSELTTGSYSGGCPYPEGTDLSQTGHCKNGIDLIGGLCNLIAPSGADIDAKALCSPLTFPGLISACALAVTQAQFFCNTIGALLQPVPINSVPVLRDVLCSQPPTSVHVYAEIFDLKISDVARVAGADITVPRAPPNREIALGTYTIPGPCTSTKKTTSTTKPTSSSTTSQAPTSTPTPVLLPGNIECQDMGYSLQDELVAGGLDAGTTYSLSSSVDKSATFLGACCSVCYQDCVGYLWDGSTCTIYKQAGGGTEGLASGCSDGVYLVRIPQNGTPIPRGSNLKYGYGWCVAGGYFYVT